MFTASHLSVLIKNIVDDLPVLCAWLPEDNSGTLVVISNRIVGDQPVIRPRVTLIHSHPFCTVINNRIARRMDTEGKVVVDQVVRNHPVGSCPVYGVILVADCSNTAAIG